MRPRAEMASTCRPDLIFASFSQRAVAFALDLALLAVFHLGAALLSLLVLLADWRRADIDSLFQLSGRWLLAFTLIFLVSSLLYSTIMHAGSGQTVGKRSMGIRLITSTGARPAWGQALLRWFAYWVSALPLGAGFFWIVLHRERCGWHDLIAATRVVVDEAPGEQVSR